MPEHHVHRDPLDLSKRYEQSDLSFPGIKKGVLIYFVFTAAIGGVVYGGMMFLHQTTPEAVHDQIPPQPYPMIQNNDTARTDIWNMRSREDYILHNYTYVDPQHEYVRIPIEKALDNVAAGGPDSIETLPDGYDTTPEIPQSSGIRLASTPANAGSPGTTTGTTSTGSTREVQPKP